MRNNNRFGIQQNYTFFLRGVGFRPVKHRQFNYLYNVQLEIKVFNNIFSLLKKGNLFLI